MALQRLKRLVVALRRVIAIGGRFVSAQQMLPDLNWLRRVSDPTAILANRGGHELLGI